MYSSKDFIISGSSVYGLVGSLLGAIIGLIVGGAVSIPAAAFSVVEPAAGVFPLIIVPVAVTLGVILGGTVGALLGAVRGAIINNSMTDGRGWLVFLLAIILAVFFIDVISGLALFLVWRKFRFVNISDPANSPFWRILRAYIFAYGMIFLVLGLIVGSGLGSLIGSFISAETNNVALVDEAVAQLAQFLNSLSLQASIDTAKGGLDAGINAIITKDLNEVSFDSYANINIVGEDVLSYSASLAAEIDNFVQSIEGSTSWARDGIQWTYSFSGGAVQHFFDRQEFTMDLVTGLVSGGMIGASQGFVYGFVFAIIFALMDHMMLKQVIAKNPGVLPSDFDLGREFVEEMENLEEKAESTATDKRKNKGKDA